MRSLSYLNLMHPGASRMCHACFEWSCNIACFSYIFLLCVNMLVCHLISNLSEMKGSWSHQSLTHIKYINPQLRTRPEKKKNYEI